MRAKKQSGIIDLKALQAEILKVREEGNTIISHFNKLLEYYDDWQDRMNAIQNKINTAEKELGLTVEEASAYDVLGELD